jgi:Transmembrane family 220, helix
VRALPHGRIERLTRQYPPLDLTSLVFGGRIGQRGERNRHDRADGDRSKTWSRAMRYVNAFLCLLFVVCTIAQYNDPDAVVWVLIYAIPAIWTGAVALRPDVLSNRPLKIAFLACLGAAIAGTIYMWPSLPENWIRIEEEREGLGLMIVTAALVVAGWTSWHRSRNPSPDHAASG